MAKLRAPLFSFSATKTLANKITYTRRRGTAIAEAVPTHIDVKSLAQLYQRWRYYDAIQHWHSLTGAQQAAYESSARRYHMTGYAYLIKQYLTLPIDQVLWLRLDQWAGTIAPDSSKHENNGTVFGAAWCDGKISRALLFDGSDDRVIVPHHSSLNPDEFTVMAWIKPGADKNGFIISKANAATNQGYWLHQSTAFQLVFRVGYGDWYVEARGSGALTPGTWYHAAGRFDGSSVKIYLDGAEIADLAFGFTFDPSTNDYWLGDRVWSPSATYAFNGIQDDHRFYTRALTPKHIAYIATKELYPPPE